MNQSTKSTETIYHGSNNEYIKTDSELMIDTLYYAVLLPELPSMSHLWSCELYNGIYSHHLLKKPINY
jgi:hypothetical protein